LISPKPLIKKNAIYELKNILKQILEYNKKSKYSPLAKKNNPRL
jgi:hypothetical protein